MDALIERIKAEVDPRTHNQVISRAMKKNIDLYHRADIRIDMRAVKVN
jgi:peptide/nickel transport system substrate-binding protein